jgi:ABC-type nitrate/sulfonate/bicarbonate transport system substrate-binding protein
LQAGSVVGALTDPPEAFVNRERGYHPLVDLSQANRPYQHNGTVATRTFIRENRAAILSYVRAISEAISLIKTNRDEALNALSALVQMDRQKDAAILEETYDIHVQRLSDIPRPSVAGIQTVLDEIATENPGSVRIRARDAADLSIVQELEDEGFFKDLARD